MEKENMCEETMNVKSAVNQISLAQEAQSLLAEAERTYQTDLQRSKTLAKTGLAICRRLHDPQPLAQALELLGRVHQAQGRLTEAKESMQESLVLRQSLDEKKEIGISLRNLSNLSRLMGKFEAAEEQIGQSIGIFTELKDIEQLALAVHTLHGIMVYGGKFAESVRLFEEPGLIYQGLDLPRKPDAPTIVSAFALMHLGRYEQAEERFRETLSIYPKSAAGYSVKNLGRIALVRGDLEAAREQLLEALTLFREAENMNGLGQALGCLGLTTLRLGNLAQAQEYITENQVLAAQTLIFLPSMTALASSALLRAEQGDVEASIEVYATALENGHVANSRWYSDVIGQYIYAASESLPAEVTERAMARGKARAWQSVVKEM